jgi:hypothetical protein
MSCSVKKLLSAADDSLSIVWSLGLNPRDVNYWKTSPTALTHSETDLDFIATGLM